MTVAVPWLQTRSGRAFPLIEPKPEHVHWPDIIYALSHINRFGGHWQTRFSSTVERRAVDAMTDVQLVQPGPLA